MDYIQNVKDIEQETGLKLGDYTWFFIDDWAALTHRAEITITGFKQVEQYAQYKNVTAITFKLRGKRKESYKYLSSDMLFLKGWDLGLKVDTDFNSFWGNACINFVGKPEEIKSRIEELNIFKVARKGVITYSDNPEGLKMLYPEIAKDEYHAVVQRIMG
jgi:hypothetical protein